MSQFAKYLQEKIMQFLLGQLAFSTLVMAIIRPIIKKKNEISTSHMVKMHVMCD